MRDWKQVLRDRIDLSGARDLRDERMLDELADHLELCYEEALIRGATPEEAFRIALAQLGEPESAARELVSSQPVEPGAALGSWVAHREDALRGRRGSFPTRLADALSDVRLAFRALGARPLFAAVVILVLAVGIGATTTIFTLADAIVLSPLPFDEPDRLVNVSHSAPARGVDDAGQAAAWHLTYEDDNQVFEDIGMYLGTTATVTGVGDPEAVPVLLASSGVFRALRLSPVLGRAFTPDDERPDGPQDLIVSHGYWQSRFGSDPDVVGRTLQVNGSTWQIAGVAPPELRGMELDPALILPLTFDRATIFVGNIGFSSVARLRDGVTIEEARADLARLMPSAWDKFAGGPVANTNQASQFTVVVRPYQDWLLGPVTRLLWILLGGVSVVLLIACANVANLFLVRAEAKETEMAVRTAMGASRLRVGWEYMRESLLLGLLGGGAGLLLAYAGLQGLLALAPAGLPRLDTVSLNETVLAVTLAISLGTGVLFGVLPGLKHRRTQLAAALKQGGRGSGRSTNRLQDGLAVTQVALALVLLVGAGLMVRSIRSLQDVDPGFRGEDEVLVLRLAIPENEIVDIDEAAATFEGIARRLEDVPGVDAVAMATRIPMDFTGNVNPFYVDGIAPPGGDGPPPSRYHNWIGEGYFETLGIPLLAGRSFTWDDVHSRFPGAIISESLARIYWDSPEQAIGQRVAARPEPVRWHEVVGVAPDVHYGGLADEPELMVYWPQVTLGFWTGTSLEQVQTWRSMGYAVRSGRVGTPGLVEDVRDAIWEIGPNLPLRNVYTMRELMSTSVAQTTFALTLLVTAALAALLLGMVGVYGVISYGVSQRTRELGVRMALGAAAADVKTLVLKKGLMLCAAGVVAGMGLALGLTRLMSGLLYGVRATDPATFAVVAVALTAVALLATYLPARRAAGVDPIEALRPE